MSWGNSNLHKERLVECEALAGMDNIFYLELMESPELMTFRSFRKNIIKRQDERKTSKYSCTILPCSKLKFHRFPQRFTSVRQIKIIKICVLNIMNVAVIASLVARRRFLSG